MANKTNTEQPNITIIIVNYKTADMVCQVIQSVKDYAPADNVIAKIIVVDNGSQDGSLDIFAEKHPDIETIDAGGNIGFSKGNNLALRTLNTDYAMLLNSDAFLEKGTLKRLIEVMDSDPSIGVVGPRILNTDRTDQDYPCAFPSVLEMIQRAIKGAQFPAQNKNPQEPINMDRIHGCCLMARREVFDEVGLLDEQFFMYDEDIDWCLRTQKAGWLLKLVPDSYVVHLGGQTSGRAPSGRRDEKTVLPFNPRMSYELRKSRYILYRKHRSGAELILLKIFTDILLLAGLTLAVLRSSKGDAWSDMAKKKKSAYFKIMAINPFSLAVKK
ncbi:MAG: hypothetical protein COB14_05215 [Alphaproteobacteria bacterium]|nr:MAG: hypothetical protein COB14_05215 [Alphaproteobacteria bacterium]